MTDPDEIRPSLKAPGIARELNQAFGRTDAIESLVCVSRPFGCGRALTHEEVSGWPEMTRREYLISGSCDVCQARIFGS